MFPKPALILLHLLHRVFFLLSLILRGTGLHSIFQAAQADNQEVILSAEPSPAVKAAAASIKSRLPAADYITFAGRKLVAGGRRPEPTCAVCLQFMEARDQVRELGNCCHAFHSSCLDRWLDFGRFSCPLCRSTLLPAPAGGRRRPLLLKLLFAGEEASSLRTTSY